ncbi:hypothetical protein EON66_09630 [archaeon]|nr:MAG: hypothetical protein EON66_09630 [archaeon]
MRNHPELSVGSATDGVEVRSVGNTQTLRDTALVEAFNLKAAIEFNTKNLLTAREALTDMPPRMEEEARHCGCVPCKQTLSAAAHTLPHETDFPLCPRSRPAAGPRHAAQHRAHAHG